MVEIVAVATKLTRIRKNLGVFLWALGLLDSLEIIFLELVVHQVAPHTPGKSARSGVRDFRAFVRKFS